MAASIYMSFADIMERNKCRHVNYIEGDIRRHYETVIPRVQMFTGMLNPISRSKYIYIDSINERSDHPYENLKIPHKPTLFTKI